MSRIEFVVFFFMSNLVGRNGMRSTSTHDKIHYYYFGSIGLVMEWFLEPTLASTAITHSTINVLYLLYHIYFIKAYPFHIAIKKKKNVHTRLREINLGVVVTMGMCRIIYSFSSERQRRTVYRTLFYKTSTCHNI